MKKKLDRSSIVKRFKEFLDENNAKDSYEHNCIYIGGLRTEIEVYERLRDDPDGSLCTAFTWNKSKEGHEYWMELNEKWKIVFKEIIG